MQGSFEEVEGVARAMADALSRGDLDAAEQLVAEDIEYVTRDGPGRGRDIIRRVWEPQMARFDISFEIERVVDAGDGRAIVLQKVDRRNRETGRSEWKAWPALVIRVRDGQVTFVEGYTDRRKAFSDLGIEPE
jgi:ketosteroid isomerase-like protein